MKEGPEPELNMTEFAQPAIMTSSILHWYYLKHMYGAREQDFTFALGHSLGEYTACVVGGALTIEDGVKLANIRGKAMQKAVEGLSIRMSAVAGSEQAVRKALAEVKFDGICEIAGINHDKQVVLSGTRTAVDAVTGYLKETQKIRSTHLNVSAPFHCKLMKPAADRVKEELLKLNLENSKIPVVSNAHTRGVKDSAQIRESLVDNIDNPALFLRGMEYVVNEGANLFTEVGAKRVLTNIVNKIIKDRKLEDLVLDLNN